LALDSFISEEEFEIYDHSSVREDNFRFNEFDDLYPRYNLDFPQQLRGNFNLPRRYETSTNLILAP
jgi:hypothetical protein